MLGARLKAGNWGESAAGDLAELHEDFAVQGQVEVHS